MKVLIFVACIVLCNAVDTYIHRTRPAKAGSSSSSGSDISRLSGTSVPALALQLISTINADNCGPGGTQNFINVLPNYSAFESSTRIARMTANYMNRIVAQNQGSVNSLSDQDYYNYIQNNIAGQTKIFASSITLRPGLHPKRNKWAPYAYFRSKEIVGEDIVEAYDYTDPTTLWYYSISRRRYTDVPQVHVSTKIQGCPKPTLETTLVVRRQDCMWTQPYFDCGGGNVWLSTHVCPVLYQKGRQQQFMGVGYIDINWQDKDINQCSGSHPVDVWSNAFSGTDRCPENSQCRFKPGSGLKRGGYQCLCERGYYSAGTGIIEGAALEAAYDAGNKDMSELQCRPCEKGCEECSDANTCLWPPNFKSGYGNRGTQYGGKADTYGNKWNKRVQYRPRQNEYRPAKAYPYPPKGNEYPTGHYPYQPKSNEYPTGQYQYQPKRNEYPTGEYPYPPKRVTYRPRNMPPYV